jgi:hypothetical protein
MDQKLKNQKCFLKLVGNLVAWPKFGLFALIFDYFFVRSPAMHSKISFNQRKNG